MSPVVAVLGHRNADGRNRIAVASPDRTSDRAYSRSVLCGIERIPALTYLVQLEPQCFGIDSGAICHLGQRAGQHLVDTLLRPECQDGFSGGTRVERERRAEGVV